MENCESVVKKRQHEADEEPEYDVSCSVQQASFFLLSRAHELQEEVTVARKGGMDDAS